jgi:NitT/TauT family transport system substrate-binding protein
MTKKSYLVENKDTVEKFTRALKKAQDWVQTESAAEVAEVIQPFFEDTDLKTIETVVDRYKSQGSFATDPILDEEEWENLQNIMDEAGELPSRMDYHELVNTEFAENVSK